MRVAVLGAAILSAAMLLSACASEGLSSTPPPGLDFSGHWKLNEADSDDPLRLLQAANTQQSAAASDNTGTGGRSGRGGRGGGYPALAPPATPSMGVLGASLAWPGKTLDVRQTGAVLAFASDGKNRVCQPRNGPRRHGSPKDPDRDIPPAVRDAPPPTCGWSDKTLIVQTRDSDDDRPPFEERYSLSEDGQRLVEEVYFKGGRSSGFSMSRVWDRVAQ